jgi:hypothetical protein
VIQQDSADQAEEDDDDDDDGKDRSSLRRGEANLDELEQVLREKALRSLQEAKQLLADDGTK